MKNIPEKDLKKLAIELRAGRIFTNRHLNRPEDFQQVFMVFMFMDEKARKELFDNPPGLIYEYLTQATPLAINGQPIFFSARMLSIADTEKVFSMVKKLEEAEAAVS